jgi:3-hydroxybutyryl-CoA dehydrogenase
VSNEVTKIVVIGAGTMGHGIAQIAAQAGYHTVLTDKRDEALPAARARIEQNLAGAVARGKLSLEERAQALARLACETTLQSALVGAGLVIEAVIEDLTLKQLLLRQVEEFVDAPCILASNTSSLPLTQIARALRRPERLLGLHFFNPVHIMALVEVVVHPRTDRSALNTALAVATRLGKEPIVVKDSPGFASSRLGVLLGLEAMRMVEEGVASAEDIDKAMTLGYKHPMGPLRLTDLVGLDVRLAIAQTLHRELGGGRFEPPQILRDKVAAGELGKKTGKGFYEPDASALSAAATSWR